MKTGLPLLPFHSPAHAASAACADRSVLANARADGFLYLLMIVLSPGSGLVPLQPLLRRAQAEGRTGALRDGKAVPRAGIAAGLAMVACDVALAVVPYGLFRRAGRRLAPMAMVFRLVQSAIVGANLIPMGAQAAPCLALLRARMASAEVGRIVASP